MPHVKVAARLIRQLLNPINMVFFTMLVITGCDIQSPEVAPNAPIPASPSQPADGDDQAPVDNGPLPLASDAEEVSLDVDATQPVYLDLDTGSELSISTEQAQLNGDWDVVIDGNNIRVNENAANVTGQRIAATQAVDFSANIDTSLLSYQTEAYTVAIDPLTILNGTVQQGNSWLVRTDQAERVVYMNIATAYADRRQIDLYLREQVAGTDVFSTREFVGLVMRELEDGTLGVYFDMDAYFEQPLSDELYFNHPTRAMTSVVADDEPMEGWDFFFSAEIEIDTSTESGSAQIVGEPIARLNGGASESGLGAVIFLNFNNPQYNAQSTNFRNPDQTLEEVWGFSGMEDFFSDSRFAGLDWQVDGYNPTYGPMWYTATEPQQKVATGRVYIVESTEGYAYRFQVSDIRDGRNTVRFEGFDPGSGQQAPARVEIILNPIDTLSAIENTASNGSSISVFGEIPISEIDGLQLSLTGADREFFELTSDFKLIFNAPDFESPQDANGDNRYEAFLRAENSSSTDVIAVSGIVQNANEPAAFSFEPRIASVDENGLWSLTLPEMPDEGDTPNGALSYSIFNAQSGDARYFYLDSSNDRVQLKLSAQDFERPADVDQANTYDVILVVSDGDENMTSLSVSVTVLDLTESAEFSLNPLMVRSIDEVTLDTGIYASISGQPVGNLGFRLVDAESGSGDSARFNIDATTGLITLLPQDYEALALDKSVGDGSAIALNVVVVATDDDGNIASTSYAVLIQDRVEYAGFDVDQVASYSLAENSSDSGVTLQPNPAAYTQEVPCAPSGSSQATAICQEDVELNYEVTLTGEDAASFVVTRSASNKFDVSFDGAADFESAMDANADGQFEIGAELTDGEGNRQTLSWTVNITDVIENADFSAPEGSTDVAENSVATITYQLQGDEPIGELTAVLSGDDAAFFRISDSGTIEFTGSETGTGADFEAPADSNADNAYLVLVTLTDADGNSTIHRHTVRVTNVTESASFSIADIAPRSVNENESDTGVTPQINGEPIGGQEALVYRLEGDNRDYYDFDSRTGVASLQPQDYESLPGSDSGEPVALPVTLIAEDTDGNVASTRISISVVDVDEYDGFDVEAIEPYSVDENTIDSGAEIRVSPDTVAGAPLSYTYELSGADAAQFTIDDTVRPAIVRLNIQDFEAPSDANQNQVYQALVTVTDIVGGSKSVTVSVTVVDVTEVADFTLTSQTISGDENSVISVPVELSGDAPIGTLNYSLSGDDASFFTLSQNGSLTLSARDFETPQDLNGDNQYLAVLSAADSDGNQAQANIAISINNVAESSSFSLSGISDYSIDEVTVDSPRTPTASSGYVGSLTYRLTGSDAARFSIDSATGTLRLKPQDYEVLAGASEPAQSAGPAYALNVVIEAADSDGNTATLAITVSVRDVVEYAGFEFAPLSHQSANENALTEVPLSVTPLSYTNPIPCVPESVDQVCSETVTLNYTLSLSGTDSDAFSLNGGLPATTLRLSAQNFEAPADSDLNNTYGVTVNVDDGISGVQQQSVIITVNDVMEVANFSLQNSDYSVNENTQDVGVVPVVSGDAPIGSLSYQITGADAGAFTLDNDRRIRLTDMADFEAPTDADGDNNYQITYTATDDDANSASVDITVTVLDTAAETLEFSALFGARYIDLDTATVSTSAVSGWDLRVSGDFISLNSTAASAFANTREFDEVNGPLGSSDYLPTLAAETKDNADSWNDNWGLWASDNDSENIEKAFGNQFYRVYDVAGDEGIADEVVDDLPVKPENYFILRTSEGTRYVRMRAVSFGDRNSDGVAQTNNGYFYYSVLDVDAGDTQFGPEQELCLSFRHGSYPEGDPDGEGDVWYKQTFFDFDYISQYKPFGCDQGDYVDYSGSLTFDVDIAPDMNRRTSQFEQVSNGVASATEALENWDMVLGIAFRPEKNWLGIRRASATRVRAAINGNRTGGVAAIQGFTRTEDGDGNLSPMLDNLDDFRHLLSGEGKSPVSQYDHLLFNADGSISSNQRVYHVRTDTGARFKIQVLSYDGNLSGTQADYSLLYEGF
ncbi:hypothetical protein SAMN05421686_10159 [Thalassolituus maritimus]|uniref:Cadherin domain-containing protein n=1 Tax=Thalassolituus maritimus TaxID=484498 RepID=A0A1N7IVY3_9GAMM|nr:cadherin repeat domain-containing protein [Thalassolituus maritimus]SIS41245.1 hypothetical protein SAMN05421686_10159 [Thalassolituus maritimus]